MRVVAITHTDNQAASSVVLQLLVVVVPSVTYSLRRIERLQWQSTV